ncbi:MAG: hypothetical protein K5798_03720 [Nitrosopumilus sp.]|uniref:hypothetical protein n=1 Tax=Nitrosopumilus sp. TaxID=2024843 RepID=UPI00242BCD96|nr:hypothetical protein [Nitrosopumilus sp.]MCV0366360.1 hypothetical protein [Nitrosopumilus sp.]
MNTFPIDELYKRMGKINLLRNDKQSVIGIGTGFFYKNSENGIYFATKRDSIIIEEKGFLPDSIVLHPNIEAKNFGNGNGITLSLYDENEKPTWRMLPSKNTESFVSIPVTNQDPQLEFTEYFVSYEQFPSKVYLPLGGISLEFQTGTAVSIANYFFYADKKSEKTIQMHIEQQIGFNINRKGFAKDMLEMTLRLLDCNISDLVKLDNGYEKYMKIHQGLTDELEKIMIQFGDILIPSIFTRIKSIFELIKQKNFLDDHLIIRHLINRVLQQIGQNIMVNS